jgi:nicotinamide mononucleotide transporter
MKTLILANFKKWTKTDLVWTTVSLVLITCVCILTWDTSENWISVVVLVGTVLGMFNVILVAKCEVWVNITTAVLVEIAMGICYLHWNMLGNAILNLFIFLPSNIAFVHWVKKQKDNTVPVGKLNMKWKIILSVFMLAITVIGGFWLSGVNADTPIIGEFMNAQFYGGNNPAPYLDAFSFIANITALILMYCLFIEQWYLWVIVDIITLIMWILTAIKDPSLIAYNYVVMYALWLLNAIYGVKCWNKSLKTHHQAEEGAAP